MSQEINFTRDYRKMFAEAAEEDDVYRIKLLFKQLCDEVGVPDLRADAEQVKHAKATAEKLNAIARGTGGGKKV